ncbi:MAG: hypothetical protein ACU843_16985 [Gammaproteobacteria bacterium]
MTSSEKWWKLPLGFICYHLYVTIPWQISARFIARFRVLNDYILRWAWYYACRNDR